MASYLSLLSLSTLALATSLPLTRHSPEPHLSTDGSSLARTRAAVRQLQRKYVVVDGPWRNNADDGADFDKRDASGVALTNVYGDATYVATVTIGGQPLLYIVDSGSADLWTSSTSCSTCTDSSRLFDPAKSSSLTVRTSETFSILYGSGSASGTLATDQVSMGSFSVSQTFGLVNTASNGLIFNPLSGIMGLAWGSIAQSRATPFWMQLVNSGSLNENLFGFALTRYSGTGSLTNPGGTLTLGYTDSSLYQGDINYVNLPGGTNTFWRIPLDSAVVGGQSVGLSGGTIAAIDTGTTLIVGPAGDVAKIYAAIPGSSSVGNGHYIFPCAQTVSVSFVFNGIQYPMQSSDMSRGLYQAGSNMCIGAISAAGLNAPMSWIIGDAFLKNVYTVFRHSPASVGFAYLPGASAPAPPSAPASPSTSVAAPAPVASSSAGSSGSGSSAGGAGSSAAGGGGGGGSGAASTSTAPAAATTAAVPGSAQPIPTTVGSTGTSIPLVGGNNGVSVDPSVGLVTTDASGSTIAVSVPPAASSAAAASAASNAAAAGGSAAGSGSQSASVVRATATSLSTNGVGGVVTVMIPMSSTVSAPAASASRTSAGERGVAGARWGALGFAVLVGLGLAC